ncbi:hypothetical protein ACJZ2D_006573 [Fusarium nematophilum]
MPLAPSMQKKEVLSFCPPPQLSAHSMGLPFPDAFKVRDRSCLQDGTLLLEQANSGTSTDPSMHPPADLTAFSSKTAPALWELQFSLGVLVAVFIIGGIAFYWMTQRQRKLDEPWTRSCRHQSRVLTT